MKNFLLLAALAPALLWAEAWRPSDFEIKGWNEIVSSTDTCSNVFSPIGLATAIAMLGDGTGGAHRANISEALGLLNDFSSTFSYLFSSYAETSASNAVSIRFAPSLWSRDLSQMDLAYRHSLTRNFGAVTGGLRNLDAINAWTAAKTDGLISPMVTAIPADADLLLLTAVSFEGKWRKGFDPARTAEESFSVADGHVAKIPLMHAEAVVTRVSADDFTAIRLPFAAKGVSMVYLLPSAGLGIDRFRSAIGSSLSVDGLKSQLRAGTGLGVERMPLKLAIPRMEMMSRWDLRPAISFFNVPESGYPHIGATLKVSASWQVAYLKIDETGFSSGGRTPPSDGGRTQGAERRQREDEADDAPVHAVESFVLNRPFIYLVWDENTDTVILAGQFTGKSS